MSVKLGRVVFRRIAGRIVPVRVGAEAKTLAKGLSGISKTMMKKADILFKTKEFKVGKTGNLLKVPEADSTKAMLKFVEKTGSVRFSRSNNTMIEVSKRLSQAQKEKLATVSKGQVFVDINDPVDKAKRSGAFKNFAEAYRKLLIFGPKEIKKENVKLAEAAVKELGLTRNADEAGFILRDGRMIDLSGKRQGGEAGVRYLDHREVSGLVKQRAMKPTDREIRDTLYRQQADRKRMSANLHKLSKRKK